MPKIICTLPNASDEISGVKFSRLNDDQLISEDISEGQAELFLSIPGYFPEDDAPEAAEPAKQPAAAPKQETTAQRKARLKQEEADAKAEQDRLAAEQAAADEAAAEKAAADAKAADPAQGGDKEEVF